MTTSQTSSASPNSRPPAVDKQQLYGDYRDAQKWRESLHKQTAHKALDIPVTDDLIQVTNTRSGLGWKELLAAAAVAATGFGGYALLKPEHPTAPPAMPTVTPPAIHAPAASPPKYEVDFFDPPKD